MTEIPELILLSIIFYLLMHVGDSAAINSIVAGKLSEKPSQGISIQNSMIVASRLPLPLILIILAFLIENEIMSLKEYLFYAILHLIPVIAMLIIMIRNVNVFQKFFQRIIFFRNRKSLPIAILMSFFSKTNDIELIDFPIEFSIKRVIFIKSFISSFAYVFLALGFFISFSFAYYFEDFRMTISQLTTVFHGFGGLLLAFFIDPMISKSVDIKAKNEIWVNNFYSIMFGRLLSYIISLFILVIYYLNVNT